MKNPYDSKSKVKEPKSMEDKSMYDKKSNMYNKNKNNKEYIQKEISPNKIEYVKKEDDGKTYYTNFSKSKVMYSTDKPYKIYVNKFEVARNPRYDEKNWKGYGVIKDLKVESKEFETKAERDKYFRKIKKEVSGK